MAAHFSEVRERTLGFGTRAPSRDRKVAVVFGAARERSNAGASSPGNVTAGLRPRFERVAARAGGGSGGWRLGRHRPAGAVNLKPGT